MKTYRNEEIRVFITPADLRKMADQAEALWRSRVPGDDLTVAVVKERGYEIVFVIDQGRMS